MTQIVERDPTAITATARVAAAMALTAVILVVALNVGMGGAVSAMFGGPVGLVVIVVVPVVAIVMIALALSACTGRRNIRAAVVVTLLAFVSLAVAVSGFGTIPMLWVEPGVELVYPLIAVPCALVVGLFLGSWRPRIVGLVGLALLVAGAVWLNLPDPQAPVPSQAEQQDAANFEAFVASGSFPMVADVPDGAIVWSVPDGGPPRTLSVSAEGGVVEVVIDRNPIATNPDITPCWYLAEPNSVLDAADTIESYASWCVRDGDLWRLTDGTGYARLEGGSLVAVSSAIEQNIDAAGERAATAAEVRTAWNSVRLMTGAEVREHLQNG